MGKKDKSKSNIYEMEQAHKKHRGKSDKLEKREHHRKNKNKEKKEKHEKRKMMKYIKQVFKENKQFIDLSRLPVDFDEISKIIKKMIEVNSQSVKEIPQLFQMMEEKKKEINIQGLEDKQILKYLLKLMKCLKVEQSSGNPFCFSIHKLFKDRDPKMKFTTNPEDIIQECLSSYYFLVKSLFEYFNFVVNNPSSEDDEEKDIEKDKEKEKQIINEPKDTTTIHKLDNEKYAMDLEYEIIEGKVGKNAELINKAFVKILNDNPKPSSNSNPVPEEEEELVGPPVPKFLESTMNLIADDNNLDQLINRSTFSNHPKNEKLSIISPGYKKEPINKESYERLLAFERERMHNVKNEMDDWEAKYRSTSLLEEYQMKNKSKKGDSRDSILKPFDREKDMNIGKVDSKRAMEILRESNGLQGRFVAKEKYLGY